MRNYLINPSKRSLAFTSLLEILEECKFTILDRDGIEFIIDGVKENPASANKHISIVGVKKDGDTVIRVDVRNISLELMRDKSNDVLEVKVLRKLHRALLRKAPNYSSTIRLSA